MPNNPKSDLGWLLAVVFAGTTALFAWQYARAHNEAASLRTGYDELQRRLNAQEERNASLQDVMQRMQRQLDETVRRIETLQQQLQSQSANTPP